MSPVTRTDLVQHSPRAKVQLATEILVAYARARRALRGGGDARDAVMSLRSHAHRHPIEAAPEGEIVAGWRLAGAVTKTISPLPADSRCLFRSLTLLSVMERRGMSPTLVIAVRPQPFAAHAWIELHGKALLPTGGDDFQRLTEL